MLEVSKAISARAAQSSGSSGRKGEILTWAALSAATVFVVAVEAAVAAAKSDHDGRYRRNRKFLRIDHGKTDPDPSPSNLKPILKYPDIPRRSVRPRHPMARFDHSEFSPHPNTACVAVHSPPISGVCYSRAECNHFGGSPKGNCAAGFGVCCVISKDCGSQVDRNCSFVKSPGYPNVDKSEGLCAFDIKRIAKSWILLKQSCLLAQRDNKV
eukprot:maker-scaffold39_size501901-snap-gene-4.20 protein:Tk00994 transcript:maker-scaffold39_size501901-snap-gene-4.20-mRNA-1 annotation:"glycoside hydrolase family 18 protein"